MNIIDMIREVQGALGLEADGKAGPLTWAAIHAAVVRPTATGETRVAISRVDPRSEQNIATLLPEVQPFARALVQKAAANGIQIKVISGLRSYEEQDALYALGRSVPGTRVTNARGGYSNHNFGIAFDIGVFEGTRYIEDSPKYKAVGVLGMDMGLEWGGSWKSIVDEPHFQMRPAWAADMPEREMLAEMRGRMTHGRPVYA